MFIRSLLCPAILSAIAFSSFSQIVTKVIRKGVQPDIIGVTPVTAGDYSLEKLSGKWQEISRTNRNDNSMDSFTDTLFLYFAGSNVYTRDGVNMSLRGKASLIHGNSLMAAADVYTIKSLDKTEVTLDDGDKYIHRLMKKQNFWYETLPSDSVSVVKYVKPLVINLKSIYGKWQVYRRDAKPGSLPTADYLIEMINATIIKDEHNISGEITFYHGEKLEILPCIITIEGDKINIISEKYTWFLHNYKADGNEFIFGNPDLMYFSKPI